MFGLFRKEKVLQSANQAKDRLRMVCSYERQGLPANFKDELEQKILKFLKNYPQFNIDEMEVELERQATMNRLSISIPLR